VTDTHELDDFDEKCAALTKRIDAGEIPSTLQLARALDLPHGYVAAALALAAIEFLRGRRH
jgi:hypothetical protein